MYYLQTRYYDPAIGRFINADVFATTDADGFLSCNMFAYCENDPVNRSDPSGELAIGAAILAGAAIGFVVGTAFGAINAYVAGENVLEGAAVGAITGTVTGAVTGFVGCYGIIAKGIGIVANMAIAGGINLSSQFRAYNRNVKAGQTKQAFKPNWKSIAISSVFAGVGTALGANLSSSASVGEAIATGCTGGYFSSLAAGTLEMITRGFK